MENRYVSRMIVGARRALGFGWTWRRGTTRIREEELVVPRVDDTVPATLLKPNHARFPLPGWVVLHGVTRPGREHPTLLRFVRALTGSGAAVLVPEIPEWRNLSLAPEKAAETVRASVLSMAKRNETAAGRIGVMGFSFGVPQALLAATDPALQEHLGAVAGFGGYCSLRRAIHFLFRGEHEWQGRKYLADPDPYGRWVLSGNYLTQVPGFEEAGDVAEALLSLARHAGDLQVGAWEDQFDSLKEELEGTIHPSRRELFRAFAPPVGTPPPKGISETVASALAQKGEAASPLFHPASFLNRIGVPVRLIHGREDRLIPFTESLRLREAFPPDTDVRVDLTGLFAHSQRDRVRALGGELLEQVRLLRIMADLLGLL